jgi:hypothetical protein
LEAWIKTPLSGQSLWVPPDRTADMLPDSVERFFVSTLKGLPGFPVTANRLESLEDRIDFVAEQIPESLLDSTHLVERQLRDVHALRDELFELSFAIDHSAPGASLDFCGSFLIPALNDQRRIHPQPDIG